MRLARWRTRLRRLRRMRRRRPQVRPVRNGRRGSRPFAVAGEALGEVARNAGAAVDAPQQRLSMAWAPAGCAGKSGDCGHCGGLIFVPRRLIVDAVAGCKDEAMVGVIADAAAVLADRFGGGGRVHATGALGAVCRFGLTAAARRGSGRDDGRRERGHGVGVDRRCGHGQRVGGGGSLRPRWCARWWCVGEHRRRLTTPMQVGARTWRWATRWRTWPWRAPTRRCRRCCSCRHWRANRRTVTVRRVHVELHVEWHLTVVGGEAAMPRRESSATGFDVLVTAAENWHAPLRLPRPLPPRVLDPAAVPEWESLGEANGNACALLTLPQWGSRCARARWVRCCR